MSETFFNTCVNWSCVTMDAGVELLRQLFLQCTGLICVKNPLSNISGLGPFNYVVC